MTTTPPRRSTSTPTIPSYSFTRHGTKGNEEIYEGTHKEGLIHKIQQKYDIEEILGRGGLGRIRHLLAESQGHKSHKDTGDIDEAMDIAEKEVLCHEVKDSIARRHEKIG